MIKPTLVILAAGLGSRYGGLKQLDGIGPNGETMLDYAVYDALQAGFAKVVFVIRKSFEEAFKKEVSIRFEDKIEVAYAYQEVDPVIEGLGKSLGREKPWGTAHAVLSVSKVVDTPFVIVNADDYYGPFSYQLMANFLKHAVRENHYCMIGFPLEKTLSKFGMVSRGVCSTAADGYLESVVERTKIGWKENKIVYQDGNEEKVLAPQTMVSMNMWGFHPFIFEDIQQLFTEFANMEKANPKAEFYIPLVVNHLVQQGLIRLKVLSSHEQWHGVTYKEDRPSVSDAFVQFSASGRYPKPLWS